VWDSAHILNILYKIEFLFLWKNFFDLTERKGKRIKMAKINMITRNPQMQNNETYRKNRRIIISFIIAVIMVTIACNSNPHFGIYTTPDYDPEILIIVEDSEPTLEESEPAPPDQSVAIQEPENQAEESQRSESVTNNDGTSEYSVSAQDFNCICQVNGNVNVELRVNGDQLEIVDSGGGVEVFDKISENTYKKSWMGFYYLTTQDGNTSKVDEEQSVVIILTNDGYIMEHYKGSESSPCCIYTFTSTN
jgi:hypothetical protein